MHVLASTLRPCHGKLPRRKYMNMCPRASKSSRRLCSKTRKRTEHCSNIFINITLVITFLVINSRVKKKTSVRMQTHKQHIYKEPWEIIHLVTVRSTCKTTDVMSYYSYSPRWPFSRSNGTHICVKTKLDSLGFSRCFALSQFLTFCSGVVGFFWGGGMCKPGLFLS